MFGCIWKVFLADKMCNNNDLSAFQKRVKRVLSNKKSNYKKKIHPNLISVVQSFYFVPTWEGNPPIDFSIKIAEMSTSPVSKGRESL